jgi:hypothetical protein
LVYFGPQSAAQPYLDALNSFSPVLTDLNYVTWPELGPSQFFGDDPSECADNQYINFYSIGLGQTDVATFEEFFGEFIAFCEANEAYDGTWTTQRYGIQNTISASRGETLYPWRDIKMQVYDLTLSPATRFGR